MPCNYWLIWAMRASFFFASSNSLSADDSSANFSNHKMAYSSRNFSEATGFTNFLIVDYYWWRDALFSAIIFWGEDTWSTAGCLISRWVLTNVWCATDSINCGLIIWVKPIFLDGISRNSTLTSSTGVHVMALNLKRFVNESIIALNDI